MKHESYRYARKREKTTMSQKNTKKQKTTTKGKFHYKLKMHCHKKQFYMPLSFKKIVGEYILSINFVCHAQILTHKQ